MAVSCRVKFAATSCCPPTCHKSVAYRLGVDFNGDVRGCAAHYSPRLLSKERHCLLRMALSWITAARTRQYAHCSPLQGYNLKDNSQIEVTAASTDDAE